MFSIICSFVHSFVRSLVRSFVRLIVRSLDRSIDDPQLFAADAAARLQRQAAAAARAAGGGDGSGGGGGSGGGVGGGRALDAARVRQLLDEARSALGQATVIKRKATDVRKAADAITAEAQAMERRIGEALAMAEHEVALAEGAQQAPADGAFY